MIIISHPTGNANVRAVVAGIADAGMLSQFYTALASFPGSMMDKLSRFPFLSEIGRRQYDSSLQPFTKTFPFFEAGRMLALKANISKLTQHETGIFSIDAVYRSLDKRVAAELRKHKKRINGVYAYEDEALMTFEEAKKSGILCLYDLPIGYWRSARKLLEIEREKWPEWVSTITGFKDSDAKLLRKDEELSLADCIFVASDFTAKTLNEYPTILAPVKVIPYGFPPVFEGRHYAKMSSGRKLNILFVGSLSQRKGIANLFAAVDKLHRFVEVTIVGQKVVNDCAALDRELAKHRWIPSLPHNEILLLMRKQDVLIFPSLFEGFGLVITEAMSQGTPVITTERTAGPNIIEHEKNGWIVQAGSTESLQQAIEYLLGRSDHLAAAGEAAVASAKSRPWYVYGEELSQSVKTVIIKKHELISR